MKVPKDLSDAKVMEIMAWVVSLSGAEKAMRLLNAAIHNHIKDEYKAFMETDWDEPEMEKACRENIFTLETYRVALVSAIANAKDPEYKQTTVLL